MERYSPPVVAHLHYEFQGWLGDELLESFPCFIASASLAASLESAGLSGYSLAPLEVSTSEEFEDMQPGTELPDFVWLKVQGTAGIQDFGLSPEHLLVVSERTLAVLQRHRVANCVVSLWG
jgi:hypothetical protein